MKFKFTIFLIFAVLVSANSQESLNISNIPDSLKTKADAVVRYHITRYTRLSLEKATEYHKYAITVFNKNGDKFSDLSIFYDNSTVIREINGTLYNALGIVVSKLKKSDIKDYSAFSDYTMFSDSRVKTAGTFVKVYPYTIEYEYSVEENGVIGFDTWLPQDDYKLAVQSSWLEFTTPESIPFRYKNLNLSDSVVTRKNGNDTSYIWQVKNLKAIEYEQLSPPFTDFQPAVLLAPNEFIYEGYQGNLNDWNSIGKWLNGLVEGRDKLPETTIAKIKEHVTGLSDKTEIVKKVYEYMQSRTRYVGVQLGIGGLRPMLASDVDKFGYGDCKALSNYTKALLNTVGIESIYTVIGNGPRKIKYPDFASMNQANHVILCVPLEKDTMWLECTSQISPCGYIGMGNSNRYALLITKQGGKLVKTPAFNKNVNTQTSEITITLDDNGNASFCSSINFKGTNYDQVIEYTIMSEKERRDKIMKELSLKNFALNKLSIENEKQSIPNLKLSMELVAQKYGSVSGNRMFVELNPYNKWEMKTEQKDKRENDIYIPVEFEESDTVKFKLPPSYEIEYLPTAQEFKSEFGHYTMNIVKNNNLIVYIRTLSINQGKFSKNQYTGLSKFFESISQADNSKMLLKKI